jgi:hypothetical protein
MALQSFAFDPPEVKVKNSRRGMAFERKSVQATKGQGYKNKRK